MKPFINITNLSILLIFTLYLASCKSKKEPEPEPIASFDFSPKSNLVAPVDITFTNTSKYANTYIWETNSGLSSTDKDVVWNIKKGGTYTMTLTAKGAGGSDTYSRSFTVADDPNSNTSPQLTASFTYSPTQNLTAPIKINFTNTSKNAESYLWDFGDGTSSTNTDPIKEFTKAGTFKVKLTAYNKTNSTSSSIDITVNAPNVVDNTGTITFWTRNDLKVGKINVTVNGVNQGNITQYHTNGVNCGSGNVNAKFNAGTYRFKAVADDGTTWEDNVTFEKGICKTQELTKVDNTGTITFWTRNDLKVGKINVTVNGVNQGNITQYHTNGVNCGSGNVNAKFNAGTYRFKAVADDGTTWESNVTFEKGVCKTQELTKVDNTGTITFWTRSDLKVGKINVTVNGVNQGNITQYHTNGVNCGSGNVNAKFNAGTYRFKAVADDGTTWESNVTFERGVCKTQELTKR